MIYIILALVLVSLSTAYETGTNASDWLERLVSKMDVTHWNFHSFVTAIFLQTLHRS